MMAWHRPGDKPLSEPVMVTLIDAHMRHSASISYRLYGHMFMECLLPSSSGLVMNQMYSESEGGGFK